MRLNGGEGFPELRRGICARITADSIANYAQRARRDFELHRVLTLKSSEPFDV